MKIDYYDENGNPRCVGNDDYHVFNCLSCSQLFDDRDTDDPDGCYCQECYELECDDENNK